MGIPHNWTEEELQWMRDNHDKVTNKEGAAHIGVKPHVYEHQYLKMGFRKNKSHRNMINMSLLKIVDKPDIAYLLGLIWADGHLKPVLRQNEISYFDFAHRAVEKDMIEIAPLMKRLGDIPARWYAPKGTDCKRQPQIIFRCMDHDFGRFLYDHDYHIKSQVSPTKILGHIPDYLHAAFWHGFFDGDGCLSIIRKSYTAHLSFSGTITQDWSSLTDRLDKLGVKWRKLINEVLQKSGKIHRSSVIDMSLRTDIKKVMTYLHSGGVHGLSRKRDKVIELDKWLHETMLHDRGRGSLNKTTKSVIRNDGKIYNSITEAAKDIESVRSAITRSIKLGYKVYGFSFSLNKTI